MKPLAEALLPIYRRNLEKYEAEGRQEQADIQRQMIADLEKRAERELTRQQRNER